MATESKSPTLSEQLDAPLDEGRVKQLTKSFGSIDYLEGWDVIEHANALFGYGGWSDSIQELTVRDSGFAYARVLLTVYGIDGQVTREDVGVGIPAGDSAEAMETALKGAVTDALKRCFRTFGNQFGNSLYDKEREVALDSKAEMDFQQPTGAPATRAELDAAGLGSVGACPQHGKDKVETWNARSGANEGHLVYHCKTAIGKKTNKQGKEVTDWCSYQEPVEVTA